ncbi:hypothetical protein [Schleiferia thermophila]|uniref:hypothetical protein n=1 Tax=Schleiferia thermophila TaxID=884107 RepID=UPI0005633C88|nr:hypothetical protein [Schleiferia thermophila]
MSKKFTKEQIDEIKRTKLGNDKKIEEKALPLRKPPTSLTSQSTTTSTDNSSKSSDKGEKKDK